jgi:phospholipid transport system substrate-binding protein
MIRSRVLLIVATVMLALLVAKGAHAGQPTEQLKPAIDRVIKTLKDPALKGEAKTKERRQALHAIGNEVFDWTEMARRALGRHWQGRTEAEREEFVKLFRDLIERSYMSTIERYSGEKITYAADSVDGDQATLKTKFTMKNGQEVPIDYRMIRRGDRWFVYDVVVENVGLVNNYRTQFNQIIQTSSYRELVRKMKNQEFMKKAS